MLVVFSFFWLQSHSLYFLDCHLNDFCVFFSSLLSACLDGSYKTFWHPLQWIIMFVGSLILSKLRYMICTEICEQNLPHCVCACFTDGKGIFSSQHSKCFLDPLSSCFSGKWLVVGIPTEWMKCNCYTQIFSSVKFPTWR